MKQKRLKIKNNWLTWQFQLNSCPPCRWCADGCERPDTSWPIRNRSRTIYCSAGRCPSRNCRVWCLCEWTICNARIRFGRSSDRPAWERFWWWSVANKNWRDLPATAPANPWQARCDLFLVHNIWKLQVLFELVQFTVNKNADVTSEHSSDFSLGDVVLIFLNKAVLESTCT